MKYLLSGVFFAVLFVAICILIFALLPGTAYSNSIDVLEFASLVVSAAALASVVFAVVTYMESVVLRSRVEFLKADFDQRHAAAVRDLKALANLQREQYYQLSLASLAGLFQTMMSMPIHEQEIYKASIRNFQLAEISMHLSYASYLSIFKAMEGAYKLDKRRFLRMEREVWEKSADLPAEERDRIREHYRRLKEKILDMLGS